MGGQCSSPCSPMQSVSHPKIVAALLMLSHNLPTVDNASSCKTGQSSLPWHLSCNILPLPLCQTSLNNLIPLKIIFMFYLIDFWQGRFPEAVKKGDCLSRTYSCAGKGGSAAGLSLEVRHPLLPCFALLQGVMEAYSKEPVHKHFKKCISAYKVILLIPSFHLSWTSTSISMSV